MRPLLDPRDEADEDAAAMAALDGLSSSMRRGRFTEALPEDERTAITIIIGGPPPEVEETEGEMGDAAGEEIADDLTEFPTDLR